MRRLLRWIFKGLCLLSLLASVSLLFGWACAQFGDRVWLRFVGHSLLVYGAEGEEVISAERYYFDPAPAVGVSYEGPDGLLRGLRGGAMGVRASGFAGVEFYNDASRPVPLYRVLVVPVAYPLLLSALPPALWAARSYRNRRRAVQGRCLRCGYDLRGNTSGRCSECGTAVEAERRVTA